MACGHEVASARAPRLSGMLRLATSAQVRETDMACPRVAGGTTSAVKAASAGPVHAERKLERARRAHRVSCDVVSARHPKPRLDAARPGTMSCLRPSRSASQLPIGMPASRVGARAGVRGRMRAGCSQLAKWHACQMAECGDREHETKLAGTRVPRVTCVQCEHRHEARLVDSQADGVGRQCLQVWGERSRRAGVVDVCTGYAYRTSSCAYVCTCLIHLDIRRAEQR